MQKESQSIDQASKAPQPPRLPTPVRITEQVWPGGTVPVVSIRCITYQHVNFIRDAIEGFLMQETTFPVEILIHDDASTDGTADIVREYQAEYPQLIRTVLQTENQWSKGREAWRRARRPFEEMVRGEFVALCEGDDYWTSPQKLQRQVMALKAAAACSACIHNAWEVDSATGSKRIFNTTCRMPRFTLREMLRHEFVVPTASMVIRTLLWEKLSRVNASWLEKTLVGDRPMQLLLLDSGPFVYIDEIMSVYRRHPGGMMQGLSTAYTDKVIPNFIEMYGNFDRSTEGRHRKLVVGEMRRLAREQIEFRLSDLDVRRNDFVFRGANSPAHMESPDACGAAVERIVDAAAANLEGPALPLFDVQDCSRSCVANALISAGDGWMQAGDKAKARTFYKAAMRSGSSMAVWYGFLTHIGSLGNGLWSLTRKVRTLIRTRMSAWRTPMRRKQSLVSR
jgi:glycosyltransferase involved in cell wall biosynthesis